MAILVRLFVFMKDHKSMQKCKVFTHNVYLMVVDLSWNVSR